MRKTWLLFGCAMVLLIAVFAIPSPYMKHGGSVTLTTDDAAGEKYGPELPRNITGGYTEPIVMPVVLPTADPDAPGKTYVYASAEQKNYHTGDCKFAYASGQQLTLYEAYYLGFSPGKCCKAPAYTGQ